MHLNLLVVIELKIIAANEAAALSRGNLLLLRALTGTFCPSMMAKLAISLGSSHTKSALALVQEPFVNNKYLFFDEGGNLDFSPKGSQWFALTCVTGTRPFPLHQRLDEYKHDCLEYGLDTECFHCSEDNPHVRHRVFEEIVKLLDTIRVDTLLVEKRKTGPALRAEKEFYPRMLGYLLRYVVGQIGSDGGEDIIVITDTLPLQRKRRAIEKTIRMTLKQMLPPQTRFRVLHHASKSHFGLQVADYCNWAILRYWTRGDSSYYDLIKPAVASEFDIFRSGRTLYY